MPDDTTCTKISQQSQVVVDRFLRSPRSHDFGLDIYECFTLMILASYCGKNDNYRVTHKILSRDTRISVPKLKQCLNSLIAKNLIQKQNIIGAKNSYSLNKALMITLSTSNNPAPTELPPHINLAPTELPTRNNLALLELPPSSIGATYPAPTELPHIYNKEIDNKINNNKDKDIVEFHSTGHEDAVSVLDYLNQQSAKKFRPVKQHLSLIQARLKSGVTVEQCKAVIDMKVGEWGHDPTWSKYLRPETLFNATKFETYLGNLPIGVTHGTHSQPVKQPINYQPHVGARDHGAAVWEGLKRLAQKYDRETLCETSGVLSGPLDV